LQNPGRLIAKQELIQAVWPDSFVTDDSLVQCTVELRRALNDRDQQLLKTVPRRGYLFAPPVTQEVIQSAKASGPYEVDPLEPTKRRISAVAKPARKLIDLPSPRTSLIGRDREVQEAAELLAQSNVRLLSLTGAGGAGKTRLGISIASSIAHKFTAGVQFVGLASITHPDLMVIALAKALDIQQIAGRALAELISDYFQDSGPFLFVLDNFE
jgi:ATP-dependent Clp protease ATP-binding subunit ClpA